MYIIFFVVLAYVEYSYTGSLKMKVSEVSVVRILCFRFSKAQAYSQTLVVDGNHGGTIIHVLHAAK